MSNVPADAVTVSFCTSLEAAEPAPFAHAVGAKRFSVPLVVPSLRTVSNAVYVFVPPVGFGSRLDAKSASHVVSFVSRSASFAAAFALLTFDEKQVLPALPTLSLRISVPVLNDASFVVLAL